MEAREAKALSSPLEVFGLGRGHAAHLPSGLPQPQRDSAVLRLDSDGDWM